MSVAGYKLRVNGGIYTNAVIDVGIPTPDESGWLSHLITGLTADTEYAVEVSAYDSAGNDSGWSAAEVLSTPAASLAWANYEDPDWQLNINNSLEATVTNFQDYEPDIVPQFTSLGHYMEFETATSSNSVSFILEDAFGNLVKCFPGGTVQSSEPDQYLTPRNDGDVLRLERISSTQFSYSVNGEPPTTINKTFSGTVSAHPLAPTVDGVIILAPLTNIVF